MRSLATVLLASCLPHFSAPETANVSCGSDEDCPSAEWVCRSSVCLRIAGGDDVPPSAVGTLVPTRGRAGTVFTLTLQSEEALSDAPTVSSDAGAFTLLARDGNTYTYTWSASGTETEGTHTVRAELSDRSLNVATADIAAFTLDYTAPVFKDVAWTLDKPALKANDTFAVTGRVEATATLTGAALTLLDGTALLAMTPQLGEEVDGFRAFTVQGSLADAVLQDGSALVVTLSGVDDVGNAKSGVVTAQRPYDTTPPEAPTLSLEGGGTRTTNQVSYLIGTAIGATAYRVDGDVSDGGVWKPFPATIAVNLTAQPGLKNLVVTFRDDAHNEAQAAIELEYAPGTDTTPPAIATVTAQNAITVQVAFDSQVSDSGNVIANFAMTRATETLTITSAARQTLTPSIVLLSLEQPMVGQAPYELTVKHVADTAGNSMGPTGATFAFLGFGQAPNTTPTVVLSPVHHERRRASAVAIAWQPRIGARSYDVHVTEGVTGPTAFFGTITAPDAFSAPDTSVLVTGLSDLSYTVRVKSDIATDWSEASAFHLAQDNLYVYCDSPCVSTAGYGTRNLPFQSIQRAINVAVGQDISTIRVATLPSGNAYKESVNLQTGVDVLGGWDNTFTNRSSLTPVQSNSSIGVTAIGIKALSAATGYTGRTVFDGFNVSGFLSGSGQPTPTSYGLFVSDSNHELQITNNIFVDQAGNGGDQTSYGAYLINSGAKPDDSPLLQDNEFRSGNRANDPDNVSYGISISASGARILNNVIQAGNAGLHSIGLLIRGGAESEIARNRIGAGNARNSRGIDASSRGVIASNVLMSGTTAPSGTGCQGLHIEGDPTAPASFAVVYNTIHAESVCATAAAVESLNDTSIYAHNIFVTASATSICFVEGGGSAPRALTRNAFASCTTRYLDAPSGARGNEILNNTTCNTLTVGPSGSCWDNRAFAPETLFTSYATRDFHLAPTGPVFVRQLGAETPLAAFDADNVARSCPVSAPTGVVAATGDCYSIGAYESVP